jgi:hypothetical protein
VSGVRVGCPLGSWPDRAAGGGEPSALETRSRRRRKKDEAVLRAHAPHPSPLSEEFDDARNQIHVWSFTVLRFAHDTTRVAPTNSNNFLFQVDVTSAKSKQFALPHPCLQCNQTQRLGSRFVELREETRKFLVLEVSRLLPLRAGACAPAAIRVPG